MATTVVVDRGNSWRIDWRAAFWASVVGGLVFAVLAMALGWLFNGESPWLPLRRIGAIALGPGALTPPDAFDLGIVATAVVIHMVLAILYGFILALIVSRMSGAWALIVGAIYGFALYVINFYGFTALFPWWADARGWVAIANHVVQGALWGGLYHAFARPRIDTSVAAARDLRHAPS